MKKLVFFSLLFVFAGSALFAGGKEEKPKQPTPVAQPKPATAPKPTPVSQPKPAPATPPHPYFSGDGGKGMSIAILVPEAKGLAADKNYLPTMAQGVFVGDFSKYSAVSVLDRQNLDKVIAENYSGYYEEEHPDLNKLGHMLPTNYIMTGAITKTSSGYALQMQITDNQSSITKASYSGTCTIAEFDNFTGIRRASADLLAQLGVALTDKSKQELAGASSAQQVSAQTALSQGIIAQKGGTEVAALSYYFQAAAFDPSLLEATNLATVMNAAITSGNIGADVRNDIQWRKDWIARLTETERYFDNFFSTSSPPFHLFYATWLIQGQPDYTTETVPISFLTRLQFVTIWASSIQKSIRAIEQGLDATGRRDVWGLSEWPIKGVSKDVFKSGKKKFEIKFELVNSQNKVVGISYIFNDMSYFFSDRDSNREGFVVSYSNPVDDAVTFYSVKVDDITDTLTIRIASVNGTDPQLAASVHNLQISALSKDEFKTNSSFTIKDGAISGSSRTIDLIIPDMVWGEPVTSIADRGFGFGYSDQNSVFIPDSITSIGREAFYNNKLTSITIGANVTLGKSSFWSIRYFEIGIRPLSSFDDYYSNNGRKAGTYTLVEKSRDSRYRHMEWSFTPR